MKAGSGPKARAKGKKSFSIRDPWTFPSNEGGARKGPGRLLKNAHLRRCPRPSSLRRTELYASLLGISGALHLGIFQQPAIQGLFITLLSLNSEVLVPNG